MYEHKFFSGFVYFIGSQQWNSLVQSGKPPENVSRWYNFIKSLDHVAEVLASIPEDAKPKVGNNEQVSSGRKDEGKFVDLPGAEIGKLVVRFPPEASG